jgi:hypothetical protein
MRASLSPRGDFFAFASRSQALKEGQEVSLMIFPRQGEPRDDMPRQEQQPEQIEPRDEMPQWWQKGLFRFICGSVQRVKHLRALWRAWWGVRPF